MQLNFFMFEFYQSARRIFTKASKWKFTMSEQMVQRDVGQLGSPLAYETECKGLENVDEAK